MEEVTVPQVHSTTPMSADNNSVSSGRSKPEGIEAIFAGILAEEQIAKTADKDGDVGVSSQFIDEMNRLIDEPIEEEYSTSPEELLQQIGHSVSFSTELNKAPEQQVGMSGEILPLEEQGAKNESTVLVNPIPVDEVFDEQTLELGNQLTLEKPPVTNVNAHGFDSKESVSIVQSVQASTQADFSKKEFDSNTQLAKTVTIPNSVTGKLSPTSIANIDGVAELEADKTAVTSELTLVKTDNKTIVTGQKIVESQAAIKPQQAQVDITGIDEFQELTESLEPTEKNHSKTLNQLGQNTQFFSGNERLEAKGDIPRFNVSLKQGLEQQVQMQDMIQRFAPVMKQQVIAMINNGLGQVEIRLDPPELGHMLVKIQVQQDQTQVQFQVANPAARELLEQATPKLREMLAEQGMNLADSQVSYHDGSGKQGSQHGDSNAKGDGQGYDNVSAEAEDVSLIKMTAEQSSGIDYYA